MEPQPVSLSPRMGTSESIRTRQLRDAANQLEATFLAEMLKSSGLGKPRDSFGGGAGEEQFSSFLVQQQADAMVRAGGIGLSEALFQALMTEVEGG